MEEKNELLEENISTKRFNTFFYLIIVQAVSVIIALLSVFLIKMYLPKSYEKIAALYKESFLKRIDIEEIFSYESGEE